LKTTRHDLKQYKNILISSAIIITFQIGLRISEIIKLEKGCLLHSIDNTIIDTSTTKLHAERTEMLKDDNELVKFAVTQLEENSKSIREVSVIPYLFLNRQRNKKGYPAGIVSHSNWNKNYVRPWLREHNFFDENGNLIDFT